MNLYNKQHNIVKSRFLICDNNFMIINGKNVSKNHILNLQTSLFHGLYNKVVKQVHWLLEKVFLIAKSSHFTFCKTSNKAYPPIIPEFPIISSFSITLSY